MRRGLFDFAGLKAFDANIDAADGSIRENDPGRLQVGKEAAARNAGDLLTNTAGLFGKTVLGDGISY